MHMASCTVCASPVVRGMIDSRLADGVTGAGISKELAEHSLGISADVINRHKAHFKPPEERAPRERKRDFAVKVRNRMDDLLDSEELDPLNKEHVPSLNAGLRAQAILDGRVKTQVAQKQAENAWLIIRMLGGEPPMLEIDDGNTIEGDYDDVSDEPQEA